MKRLEALRQNGCFKKEFYSSRLRPDSFDSYERFCEIPFCTKEEIRATNAYERTSSDGGDVYGIFSSSGTTGEKTYYIYSREDKRVHEEFVRTFFSQIGIGAGDLGGVCAPIDTGVMAHTMMWQFTTMGAGYVTCVEPSPENIVSLVTSLPVTAVATRPDILSTVAYRPEWAQAAKNSRVTKLLPGGGFLSGSRRKLLEKTWNAKAYNMFGMSEMFGPMAGECTCQDGQHYLDDYLMIEIIDPETGMPAAEGAVGVAVYTTLWKKGFPLLRYWTDDVISLKNEPCGCGSSLPRIYYHGRLGDCIRLGDRIVFPRMLEEILIDNGCIFSYRAEKSGDSVTVTVETPDAAPAEAIIAPVRELFNAETAVRFVGVGALGYKGHGKKFFDE